MLNTNIGTTDLFTISCLENGTKGGKSSHYPENAYCSSLISTCGFGFEACFQIYKKKRKAQRTLSITVGIFHSPLIVLYVKLAECLTVLAVVSGIKGCIQVHV